MICECKKWAGLGAKSFGLHHHVNCPKYETEKFPYLFYYEEAFDAWIPAPDKSENIVDLTNYDDGEKFIIECKRVDLTDKEYAELPEAD